MHVVILNNQAQALVNFWTPLIQELTTAGHSVLCLVPFKEAEPGAGVQTSLHAPAKAYPGGEDDADATLRTLGAQVRHYPLDRKGLNPWRDMRTALALYRLYKEERPDVVYASTIKPVIYGLPAALLAGVGQRFAMITGLGYMFEADSLLKKGLTCIAALLYRMALGCSHVTFFQNADDVRTFQNWHCVSATTRLELTKGTGVDITRFAPAPLPDGPMVFLLVARLLEAKGLHEYAAAARLVKTRFPEARFQLLGPPEEHRGGVPLTLVRQWHEQGLVEYLGETRDTRPFVRKATVVVLPSWREGMPCSLMEGMSMARPVIATDVPGCREVVHNGVNGLLVPAHDPASMAMAMETFCADPTLAVSMGQAGRRLAEDELDALKAARHIATVMNLLPSSVSASPSADSTRGNAANEVNNAVNANASPSQEVSGVPHAHQ